MGLLDDAIREHLELKRRRGADPAEVAQQEREALGPVRGAADTATAEPPVPAEPAEPAPELAIEPDGAPVAEAEPALEREPEHHGAVRAPDPEPDPEPAPPEALAQPTRQFSADELDEVRGTPDALEREDVVPADEDPGEDVLDETPDVLQEAPEHDRLWFEQRPPRDFDF